MILSIIKDSGQHAAGETPDACAEPQRTGLALSLADDVRIFHYDLPKPAILFRKASVNLDFEIEEAFLPVLPLLDGQHTLEEIIAGLPLPSGSSSRLRGFMQEVLADSVPNLLRALLRQGFLKQTVKQAQPETVR